MITIGFLSFTIYIIIGTLMITLFAGIYIVRKQCEFARMELKQKKITLKIEEKRLELEEMRMNNEGVS